MKKERKVSKKAILLDILENRNTVPVSEIANLFYGGCGLLEHIKVVNLLSAYRVHDPRFKKIRVRDKQICVI